MSKSKGSVPITLDQMHDLLSPLNNKLSTLEEGQSKLAQKVDGLERGQTRLAGEVNGLCDEIKQVKKQLREHHDELIEKSNTILHFVEANNHELRERVDRIEEHLRMTP
ncbi:MAG: hypothetical protein Q8P72_01805 [Candidatus Roizmanbacteria bacterium]|nr:hypothetical protein [Candidatus Roizmanbacteria bacterium]